MIALRHVEKIYETKDKKVKALSDVSLSFRDSEFVCILGHSGCGKTTLLNVLGGLDRYTSGDILIDGRSTKEFGDADWDGYRSEKVGFVFQSYNLISHQTALENVETALTIGGIGAKERRKRAIDALVRVGLAEHLRKKPRQLSGGEMQRVAIARAIVNNPSIILADEPTGALDSGNSVAVMDLLREISRDRLVITVTHNDELAQAYATRIIRIKDGKIVSDSNPYQPKEKKLPAKESPLRSSMPYSLAAKLSLKNLAGKKVRSILTSVAASIAVIGIALVLACSTGLNAFIDKVQKDTMSATPVTVAVKATTYEPYFESILGYVTPKKNASGSSGSGENGPTPDVTINHTLRNATKTTVTNHITQEYLDYVAEIDEKKVTYDLGYSLNMKVYKTFYTPFGLAGNKKVAVDAMVSNASKWQALPGNADMVYEQYDLIGKYPSAYNELALVVGKDSSVSDALLTSYYLDVYSSDKTGYSYDEILNGGLGSFYLLSNDQYYYKESEESEAFSEKTVNIVKRLVREFLQPNETKENEIRTQLDAFLGEGTADKIDCFDGNSDGNKTGIELKIVGIFRLKEDTQYGMLSSSPVCYTQELTDLVKVLSYGGEFNGKTYARSAVTEAQLADMTKSVLDPSVVYTEEREKQNALASLGYSEIPTTIRFYPNTIKDKDYLLDYLDAYNEGREESDQVKYVDNVGVAIEYVRSILTGVSAILIALTSVSLVVSAIMIGIITYVSVIERTKEIGILRSVGARKKDVVRLFVTETGIIGFAAGVLGLVFTSVAVLPLNALFYSITGVARFVRLGVGQAAILLAASVLLTVIAGLIPSLRAGKADPVKALRSE
ncbi:MAG: ABC transporter ATP-binding protein/permease [Candidatus Borkfalkiaceae bacterium]|nr:ABC transporter ATP-binding protein/permease [Christensenellaceae bacterium]